MVDGRPSLIVTDSEVTQQTRHWHRAVYALSGATLVLERHDSGTLSATALPPADLPLANRLICGTAHA